VKDAKTIPHSTWVEYQARPEDVEGLMWAFVAARGAIADRLGGGIPATTSESTDVVHATITKRMEIPPQPPRPYGTVGSDAAVGSSGPPSGTVSSVGGRALPDPVAERFARGEIDEDEYQRRARVLEKGR
jgi:hypothetical protein